MQSAYTMIYLAIIINWSAQVGFYQFLIFKIKIIKIKNPIQLVDLLLPYESRCCYYENCDELTLSELL